MTSRLILPSFVIALALGTAGCRQADGTLPTAESRDDVVNRLGDMSRDLLSVSRGDTQARQDLADDLRVFVDGRADAVPAVDELARRTADVVAGKTLNEQSAQRLAHQLWTVAAARDLSDRQVETVQNDLHGLLISAGVPEDNAVNVASQAGEVQKLVTNRERRWYEMF
jgi:type IV pilus biogenesis protein CpaD/CtpE